MGMRFMECLDNPAPVTYRHLGFGITTFCGQPIAIPLAHLRLTPGAVDVDYDGATWRPVVERKTSIPKVLK